MPITWTYGGWTLGQRLLYLPYHQNYFFQYLKEHYPRHYQNVVDFDNMLENMQPPSPIRNRVFLSRSRKRIRDLRPEDCDDAQTFDYQEGGYGTAFE